MPIPVTIFSDRSSARQQKGRESCYSVRPFGWLLSRAPHEVSVKMQLDESIILSCSRCGPWIWNSCFGAWFLKPWGSGELRTLRGRSWQSLRRHLARSVWCCRIYELF